MCPHESRDDAEQCGVERGRTPEPASTRPADLPPDNLVSALVALETTRDRKEIERHLRTLIDLLTGQEDDELGRARLQRVDETGVDAGAVPAERD